VDELVAERVGPFVEDQVKIDYARLSLLRQTIFSAPAPEPPAVARDRVRFAQVRPAAPFDPTPFRALWASMGMLRRPDELYTSPCSVTAPRAVFSVMIETVR
jgi:hypothetical protein